MEDKPLWVVLSQFRLGIEPINILMFEDEREAFTAALTTGQRYLQVIQAQGVNPEIMQVSEDLVQEISRALQNRMSSSFQAWFFDIYSQIRQFSKSIGNLFELHISQRYPHPKQWTERRRIVPTILRALDGLFALPGITRAHDAKHNPEAGYTRLKSPIYYTLTIKSGVTNIMVLERLVNALKGKETKIYIQEMPDCIEVQHHEDENPQVVVSLEFQNRPPETFTQCTFSGDTPVWQLPVSVNPTQPIVDYLNVAPSRVLLYAAGFVLRMVSRLWWPLAVSSDQPNRDDQLTYIQNTLAHVDDWLSLRYSARDTAYWEKPLNWELPVSVHERNDLFLPVPQTCDDYLVASAYHILTAMRDISTIDELDALGSLEELEAAGISIRSPLRSGLKVVHMAINLCIGAALRAYTLTSPPIHLEDHGKVPIAQSKTNQYIDQMWAEFRTALNAGEPYLVRPINLNNLPEMNIWAPEE